MTHEESSQAFAEGYLRILDARVARSVVVGSITLRDRSAALFFDSGTGKFSLLEKTGGEDAVSVFDTIQREQWGRQVMLFGHETHTGGYIASGHGTLTGDQFAVRLANGNYYRFTVDPTLPQLAPYFVERSQVDPQQTRPPKAKHAGARTPGRRATKVMQDRPSSEANDLSTGSHAILQEESHDDFTEEDLARLRGEIPMSTKKAKHKTRNVQ